MRLRAARLRTGVGNCRGVLGLDSDPVNQTTAIVLRRSIWHFDAGPCFYCGRPTFRPFDRHATRYVWSHTRDHVVPGFSARQTDIRQVVHKTDAENPAQRHAAPRGAGVLAV